MAKRFIDSELFADEWFSDLSKDGKLFWVYFITTCDHAGILKVNEKLIKFQTGINSIETVIQELGNSIERVNEDYLFCRKFLKFQYPDFPKSRAPQQSGAIKILIRHGLWSDENNSLVRVNVELPNSNGEGKGKGEGEGKEGGTGETINIPSKDEFLKYCFEILKEKYKPLEFSLIAKYDSWVENKWRDGYGEKIKVWKTKIRNTIPHLKPMQDGTHKQDTVPSRYNAGEQDYTKTKF